MNNPVVDPKNQALEIVKRYGFKEFGISETKEILVIAPNGQVITLQIAYNFVKTKIIDAQASAGGPEKMPNMPSMPNLPSNQPDKSFETNVEKEKSIEKQSNTAQTSQSVQKDLAVKHVAPQVAVVEPKIDIKFGDGFYPKSFDPQNPDSVQKFIAANSSKDDKVSAKWLSELWGKFIKELAG